MSATTTTREHSIGLDMLIYRERIPDEAERRKYGIEYSGEAIAVGDVLLVPDVTFSKQKLPKGYLKDVYDTKIKRMVVDEIQLHKELKGGKMYTMLICTREAGAPNK